MSSSTQRFASVTTNPVLPGFHPDPSICRVDDDFFLVTSTFEYFPGLPIHHSRDLVNWRLIGHVLDHPDQLNLDGVRSSGGLYAPTIRWHQGVFYLVCTLVGSAGDRPGGNFVVTATDPAGPWSEPVWLGEPESFDPSLLFTTDLFGRDEAWFCASRPDRTSMVTGGTEIWVQAFDPEKLSLAGPQHVIWHGALVDAVWAEAPHIYRAPDGDFLLVIAEGGTAHDHAMTCARSDRVIGPYRNNPRNPVLTHRHLGERYPVVGAGHADLVEAPDGSWWVVALAMRTRWAQDGYHYPMGRETFLAEVSWEDGWPVVNPGVGALREYQAGLLGASGDEPTSSRDDFDRLDLSREWSFVRTPRGPMLSLTERPGWLALYSQPVGVNEVGCPAFICRPQTSWDFTAAGLLNFAPRTELDVSGIVLRQNEDFSLQLLISANSRGERVARAVRRFAGVDEVVAEFLVAPGSLLLEVTGDGLAYHMAVDEVPLATLDGRGLSTSLAGGFTGTMVGPYVFTDPLTTGPTSNAGHRGVPPSANRPPVSYWDWFEFRS
jgi:xylan 1,4-beta-xylosidase